MKIKINRKNSGRGPEPRRGERGSQNFSIFFIFNFALKDFLIQLQRNSTLLGGQSFLPTLYYVLIYRRLSGSDGASARSTSNPEIAGSVPVTGLLSGSGVYGRPYQAT